MQVSRRVARLAIIAVGVPALASISVLTGALISWAQTTSGNGCTQFATFDALGNAVGVQSVQSAPGATLVQGMDANLPGAQAEFDSSRGSTAWAGAPYSDTVAGNVGNANVNPNQVPIFAVSSFPAQPSGGTSTPGSTVQATSNANGSKANAVAGGIDPGTGASGRVSTTSSASCASDGTLKGVADSTVDAFSVGGVLRIGAVTSHADATLSPGGAPVLNGSTSVAGMTVLGQPVSMTDKGLVVPGTTLAAPANPLTQALSTAGISMQYLAVSKNPANGQVVAPGLEVTVTANDQGLGVGAGSASTTYILGQAEAVAVQTGGGPATNFSTSTPTTAFASSQGSSPSSSVPVSTAPPATPTRPSSAAAVAPAITSPPPTSAAASTYAPTSLPSNTGTPARSAPAYLIGAASNSSFYAAVALGGTVLLVATVLFAVLGVRLKWR